MKKNIEKTISIVRWILVLISIVLIFPAYIKAYFNVLLFATVAIWIANIIYSFQNIKQRIFFLFFNLAQFVFLMARPVIDAIRGEKWWELYELNAERFAVTVVYISLLFLHIGALFVDRFMKTASLKNGEIKRFEENHLPYLQLVSLLGVCITAVCNFAVGIEKIIFIQGKVYTDYYSSFASEIPYFFQVIAGMLPFFVCIFLATKPRKKWSFIVLLIFIVTSVPMLIVGVRNEFVLNCIFAFLYYFVRDAMGDSEKWIGKFEKICVILAIPLGIVFLSMYNYMRMEIGGAPDSVVDTFLDFFSSQGSSFYVLVMGVRAIPYLPQRSFRNYTFGGIIDYVTHGTIAQKFFDAAPLPPGNNMMNALESNNFSHNMSYVVKGKELYLAGEGYGSSYILETYTDFGFLGIILFSLILGMILVYAMKWLKNNFLTFTIVLVSLTTIFFTPRAEALGWIQFLLYLRFWIPVIGVFLGAVILKWGKYFFTEKWK